MPKDLSYSVMTWRSNYYIFSLFFFFCLVTCWSPDVTCQVLTYSRSADLMPSLVTWWLDGLYFRYWAWMTHSQEPIVLLRRSHGDSVLSAHYSVWVPMTPTWPIVLVTFIDLVTSIVRVTLLFSEYYIVFVVDDSSLHQAIKLKTKRNKRARQDHQPSLMQRQVTRLHFKTIAECLKPLYLCFKVRERNVTLGKCGWESRGQVRLLLRNTEGLYTTVLQLLTNTMRHVRCYASLSVVRLGLVWCGCNRGWLSCGLRTLGIATLGPLCMWEGVEALPPI
jgi:hypothetical protein